LLEADFYTFGT